VQRWQDMWTTSSGISTDTAIYCFRRTCRYEPLVSKLKRVSRDKISIAELFDIAKRYADEDHALDSDDEYGQRRNRRAIRPDNRRDHYRLSTRPGNGKRRSDCGNSNFVANANYGKHDPKYSRRDSPPGKWFDPA
jgi:hypothetical protein